MTSVIVLREVFRKQARHKTIVRFSFVNLSALGGSSFFWNAMKNKEAPEEIPS